MFMNNKRKVLSVVTLGVLAFAVLVLMGVPASRVAAIEPTPLPQKTTKTLISIEVSKPNANPGDTFDLTITIDTDTPTWGAQFALHYDPKLVTLDSNYDKGNFYQDYASAHNGTLMIIPALVPDNTKGLVPTTGFAIVGVPIGSGGPSGKGTLAILHGKVNDGVKGTEIFRLSDVKVSDTGNDQGYTAAFLGVMVQDGVMGIAGADASAQAPHSADVAISQENSTPTPEPTIAKRTSLDQPGSSSGSIPWVIILPAIGVVLVAGVLITFLKKK